MNDKNFLKILSLICTKKKKTIDAFSRLHSNSISLTIQTRALINYG